MDEYDEILIWARAVQHTAYADATSINDLMVDSYVPGAISLCSIALKNKWANDRKNAFPVDDRQYYYPITGFLTQKVNYQAFASQ